MAVYAVAHLSPEGLTADRVAEMEICRWTRLVESEGKMWSVCPLDKCPEAWTMFINTCSMAKTCLIFQDTLDMNQKVDEAGVSLID